MAERLFVVKNHGFPRVRAMLFFAKGEHPDVEFYAGGVNARGTYLVNLKADSRGSLRRAADQFREALLEHYALVTEVDPKS